MIVLTFQPRFAPLVASGAKRHTIRARRKRPVCVGDQLSLRRWTGSPYRSPQETLRDAFCTVVSDIVIGSMLTPDEIHVDGYALAAGAADDLARADGFAGLADMLAWFETTHALPFSGVLIAWEPTP